MAPSHWDDCRGLVEVSGDVIVPTSAGDQPIPREELTLAGDLYTALQGFYRKHAHFKERPLFITGESYAGKWV